MKKLIAQTLAFSFALAGVSTQIQASILGDVLGEVINSRVIRSDDVRRPRYRQFTEVIELGVAGKFNKITDVDGFDVPSNLPGFGALELTVKGNDMIIEEVRIRHRGGRMQVITVNDLVYEGENILIPLRGEKRIKWIDIVGQTDSLFGGRATVVVDGLR